MGKELDETDRQLLVLESVANEKKLSTNEHELEGWKQRRRRGSLNSQLSAQAAGSNSTLPFYSFHLILFLHSINIELTDSSRDIFL